jgi:hypothetical protein
VYLFHAPTQREIEGNNTLAFCTRRFFSVAQQNRKTRYLNTRLTRSLQRQVTFAGFAAICHLQSGTTERQFPQVLELGATGERC